MMFDSTKQTLGDLGERRIVRELIFPRFPKAEGHIMGIGDDCAVLPNLPADQNLVITTDPCPTPIVCLIETPDYFQYGRLTMLINVSDLAAMGAKPLGIVVSTVMPEIMPVADYERFLDGLKDASHEWSCPIIGGNIKDGPEFTATGTAIGAIKHECMMRRMGAKSGDRVCVIGEMGLFWAALITRLLPDISLDISHHHTLDKSLYRLSARVKEGQALAEARSVTSCMDSSDGVGACLQELASVNQVDIVIDSQSLMPHPSVKQVAARAAIDVRKLMLSWGNWELVCTVPSQNVDRVRQLIEGLGTSFSDIGEVAHGTGKVWLNEGSKLDLLNNFSSERFSNRSYFTHGLEAYFDFLKTEPIVIQ
ncbi:MAG: thiamine-phosphate kinase [Leptolyngbya sp. SIO3F4]|nr:thiamine-phosphate kinase [Leptolyngbya sp. SIO3F4]